MSDLQNYYKKVTKSLMDKRKRNKLSNFCYKPRVSSQRRNENGIFSKGVLGGSFYVKYSQSIDEKVDLHANSMVKARLQGNILDVIKRNAEEMKDYKEKALETVMELPSKMFSATRDAPDISLFRRPQPKIKHREITIQNPNRTLSELGNTIQFKPQITSTPLGPRTHENLSFESHATPIPIRSQEIPNSIVVDVNEKYEKIWEIMTRQNEIIQKTLFDRDPSQILVMKQKIREVIESCNDRTYSSSEMITSKNDQTCHNLNETYTIEKYDISSIFDAKSTSTSKNDDSLQESIDFLTQAAQNQEFRSQMEPVFEMSPIIEEEIELSFLMSSPTPTADENFRFDESCSFTNFFNKSSDWMFSE